MKAVVGLDHSASSRAALDLLLKMQFQNLKIHLIHCIESVLPDGTFIEDESHPIGEQFHASKREGKALLDELQKRVELAGYEVQTEICLGPPAAALDAAAKKHAARVIAVGRNRRSVLDDFLLGSTARDLLRTSSQHLLIVQAPLNSGDHLKAIFAADQRFESGWCVEELIDMHPEGLAEIEAVTVNCVAESEAHHLVRGLDVPVEVAEQWISAGIRERNEALAHRLERLGAACSANVVYGHTADDALAFLAERDEVDLLILAAHPHGFLDRHLHHSISEGLLASGTTPLFVLRPPADQD